MAPTDAPKTRSARMPRRIELLEHADLHGAAAAAAGQHEGGARRGAGRCRSRPAAAAPPAPSSASDRRSDQVGAGGDAVGAEATVARRSPARRRWRWRSPASSVPLWRCRHALPPGDVVAHRPHDDDHDQHDHGDDEDPEDDEEGGVRGRSRQDEGGCHALVRVEEVSHPVGTLRPWSSSPHVRCAGPRRRRPAGGRRPGEVLALLRGDAAARPRFDPGLAGGLRAWLEDAAYGAVAARGEHAPPLVLGPRQLLGTAPTGATARGERETGPTSMVVARLVHALFRQLVHDGTIDDPLGDALDALRAGEGGGAWCATSSRWPDRRARPWRRRWRAHAAHLADLVPRFAPGWMPRTDDRVAIPLAGGRVVLHGCLRPPGRPARSRARPRSARSACPPAGRGPGSGGRCTISPCSRRCAAGRPRSGWPCWSRPRGRYGIEDVREEHLRAMASHVAAWLAATGRRPMA